MKPIKLLLIVAALTSVLTVPALAKGDFNIVTIAGPDWYGEIEITDADLLPSLDMNHFMNLDHPIAAPAQVGRGYLLTRGYVEGSERHMFDRIVYFPGSPGYAYYLEIVNGAGPMDGNWYTVSEQGEQAIAAGLQKHGVNLTKIALSSPGEQPAGGAVANAGEPGGPPPFNVRGPEAVGLLIGAILLGSLAGWALRGIRLEHVHPAKR